MQLCPVRSTSTCETCLADIGRYKNQLFPQVWIYELLYILSNLILCLCLTIWINLLNVDNKYGFF